MEQDLVSVDAARTAPRFYLTGRQPLRPGAIVLAVVVAAGAIALVLFALGRTGHVGVDSGGPGQAARSAAGAAHTEDDKDDPSQVDTIVLGDPADAPVPGRKGDHVSSVHPTILVQLPRFGEQVGLIPDTAAGHLLYGWLAAFNQSDAGRLGSMLPDVSAVGQMELRRATGGFNLVSAKEVQAGVMVFRLRDQTALSNEVLGTLQVREGSSPAAMGSFSLRAVERRSAEVGR